MIFSAMLFAIPFTIVVSTALVLWENWWLWPLWAEIMVPLNFPSIEFWHFASLNIFISAMWGSRRYSTYAPKDEPEEGPMMRTLADLLVSFTRPVLAFYIIGWFLG